MISMRIQILVRFFDLILSIAALFILAPLIIVTIVVLRFTGEGEVFFRQIRIGRNETEFNLLKFATMQKNSPLIGLGELTISDDPRVLPFGKFLRKTKINELPQLINIILGDLSIIGPRPQPSKYFYAYDIKDREYITQMRPGLSGIGSILFRNEEFIISSVANPIQFDTIVIIPYKGKVEKWFVCNFSILLYFELIAFTLLVVFFPRSNFHKHILKRLPCPPAELASYL